MTDIRVRPSPQNSVKVRVGQQNTTKVVSSSTVNYVGIAGYSAVAGISSYSNYAGISSTSVNVSGGSTNTLLYQIAPGITSFIPAGDYGEILYISVDGTPTWVQSPPLNAIAGLTVFNQNTLVGNASSITTLRIVGSGLSASLGVTDQVANLEIIEIDAGEY